MIFGRPPNRSLVNKTNYNITVLIGNIRIKTIIIFLPPLRCGNILESYYTRISVVVFVILLLLWMGVRLDYNCADVSVCIIMCATHDNIVIMTSMVYNILLNIILSNINRVQAVAMMVCARSSRWLPDDRKMK